MVPRIFLIEAEYALAMRRAELGWVRGILSEIESGTLPGIAEWRRYFQTGEMPPEFQALLNETAGGPKATGHQLQNGNGS